MIKNLVIAGLLIALVAASGAALFPEAGAATGGDDDLGLNTDVLYRVGAWALQADEVLVVEGRFPAATPYWIFQIEDRWHETADFRRRRVHLNDASVVLDAEGRFEIVMAPDPVDHPNALDAGGRREGFMSFRWVPLPGSGDAFDVTTRIEPRSTYARAGTR